jgi:hypothetical protein
MFKSFDNALTKQETVFQRQERALPRQARDVALGAARPRVRQGRRPHYVAPLHTAK